MPQILPATVEDEYLIAIHYNPADPLVSAELFDNKVLGWVMDAAEPPSFAPVPRIIGSLPPKLAVDTAPVLSPQWAIYQYHGFFVPDVVRFDYGEDLLTWLATNNGAQRKLRGHFVINEAKAVWDPWAASHPDLVYTGP